ncbi:MAG: toluene monooxygenase [Alphaproteobacteria bacterium]|nr:toluene monooxygenase [Alphaproteobacteria bacterium]
MASEDLSKPLKTWSHLVRNKRRPTEYEIVSTNMLWSTGDQKAPWAMGPGTPMTQWYVKYRNQSPLKHADWDGFRDPDQLVYRTYNMIQDGQESFVDALLEDHSRNQHDLGLSPASLELLAHFYTPARYVIHTVQMASAYLVTMAPASTIENCFIFQSADQLRWVSRIAYRTAELKMTHPHAGFDRDERGHWENDAAWQGFRELMEKTLVAWDWAEQFVALNLVAKPAIDEALLRQFANLCRRQGDTLTALLLDAQMTDSARSRRWTTALIEYALKSGDPGNRALIERWLAEWVPLGDAAIEAFCPALGPEGASLSAAAKAEAAKFRAGLGFGQ